MANAGRVGIKPEGEYVSGRTYERLSLVTYNDSVYLARRRTAVIPSDGDNWMFIITTDKAQLDQIAKKLDDLISTGASRLANASSVKTAMPGDNTMIYTSDINVGNVPGLFPTENNANAMLSLSRHPGKFYTQVGFSSNGDLYYRHVNGADFTASTPWKQIAFITSNVASATTVNGHTVNADVPANAKFTDTKVGYGISPIPLILMNVNNDYDDEHWNLSRYVFHSSYGDIKLVAGTLYLFNFSEVNNKVDVFINHGLNYYQLRKKLSSGAYETTFGTVRWDPDHYHQDNWSGATGSGLLSPSSYYLTIFTGTTFDIISTM